MIFKNVVPRLSIVLFLAVIPTFIFVPLACSQGFEGVIHYKIPELKGEIGTSKLDYMVKKQMIRIEYQSDNSHTTSLLYEDKNHTMFLNLSSLGGFVEVPPDDVKKNIMHKDVKFKKTRIKKIIADQSCTVSETSLDGTTYRYCFAKGMGNFILPVNSMTSGSVPEWASFSFPDGQLPLQVIRMNNNKKGEVVMTTTRIEKKKLDRNLFSVFN